MQIRQLILETAEPVLMGAFYKNVLGLDFTNESNRVTIHIGKSRLIFKQAVQSQNPFYHFAINIPSNKIFEARAWISEKVKLIWLDEYHNDIADFVNWNAASVYFYDVAGNIVELIARSDLNNVSDQPFSARQLLSLNEIGIVFPKDTMAIHTSALISRNRLNYFSKQPPLENFKAVGDDEGLFIIVPQHRNWYPTDDRPSGLFPLTVEFENDGKIYKETF
jgi:catechol-2,3-dioxygenase